MEKLMRAIDTVVLEVFSRIRRTAASDRGDVPGWVLVTVMTAGLVVAIWTIADGQLKSILSNALHSVGQP
jgi:hypothetical protein